METILKIKNGQMMATCEINGVMFIQLAEFESVFARAAIAEEENAFLKEKIKQMESGGSHSAESGNVKLYLLPHGFFNEELSTEVKL